MADIDAVVRALVEAQPHSPHPRIQVTFQTTTEESADEGDYAETGWVDEEGVSMLPEEGEEETAVEKAIQFLRNEGVNEPSSLVFHSGIWYSTEPHMDMHTGEERSQSYHLVDFTEDEERRVFEGQGFLTLPKSRGPTPEEFN